MATNETLSLLERVSSAFFDRLDRHSLIGRILDVSIHLTQGDRGSVFLAPLEEEGTAARNTLSSFIATGTAGKQITVPADKGVAGYVFRTGSPLILDDAANDSRFFATVDASTRYRTDTILCVPLRTPAGRTVGVIEILNSKNGRFSEDDLKVLQILSLFAAIALEQRDTVDHLKAINDELKDGAKSAVLSAEEYRLESKNPVLRDLYEKLPGFAASDSNMLIEGDSGTGKELIAQLLHLKSRRRGKAFVAVNCAAIPESLFEAELFGVARGAATGTVARKGKLELAHEGTIFLDEIGELPLSMQAKLLRVLQEKAVTRVGSEERPKAVNFRFLAATNRNLAEMVREGKFREDLYYRINVIRIHLPPLRERKEDIPALCQTILERFTSDRGWKLKQIAPSAMERIASYAWPGNIRQLQNKLESAMILSGARTTLELEDFQLEPMHFDRGTYEPLAHSTEQLNLRMAKGQCEANLIRRALEKSGGNKSKAATLLGITREGLRKAMSKLDKKASQP